MHEFDQVIALTPTPDGGCLAHTSAAYANMIGPFGGATCAVLLNAVLQHPDRLGDPVAFTLNFTAPVADGPFRISARAARTNRSTQHWVIEASQDDGVVALATAVLALRRPTWSDTEARAPQDMPAPDSLPRMGTQQRPAWVQRYDMRFAEGEFPQAFDGQEQIHSQSRLWLRDDPPRPLDFPALLAISDSFFPRIFIRRRRLSPIGTVSITTYFHADAQALAAQGDRFLMGSARAHKFHNGFFDQSGELWSHDGQLLATTHQTVYFKD
ncbi:acyl-CoA thioesterase [Limnohabitans sp. 2KL-1]|uniref:acyl-CoA thioesterase n=1 Tax=Limnohabitans sp. 2KL-1 TaxID=1100699 RepID=UPI000D34133B|nr:thioesterase family protein [Limnohabitans sp. 2KL-1]PUE45185.1 acyl-CoA thioesterase [Limnohabitans sp. 2KL-1]